MRKLFRFIVDVVALGSAFGFTAHSYGNWWGLTASVLVAAYGLWCYCDGAESISQAYSKRIFGK